MQAVWRWFATCDPEDTMRLEIHLDGKLLQSYSFPICRVDLSEVSRQDKLQSEEFEKPKILVFTFRPARRIVWTGYRETDNTTNPNQALEGNIWQAGGEPDVLLLGVSFVTKDSIMMNTIHIASAATQSRSEIVKGLLVTTYAVKAKRKPQQ
jgi:hypothetical protein